MNITNFDATNIPPQQSNGKHPEGKGFPFQITNTYGKKNNNTPGGQFVVEMSSPAGMIANRYNLWNENDKAREIAHKELSALCHAVGIFKLSFENITEDQYGRELRGGRGIMDVGPQSNDPNYNEVKKVYDVNGNEPGKSGAAAAPQPQGQANGGWGAPAQGAPATAALAATAAPAGWQPGPPNTAAAPAGGTTAQPPWARS